MYIYMRKIYHKNESVTKTNTQITTAKKLKANSLKKGTRCEIACLWERRDGDIRNTAANN